VAGDAPAVAGAERAGLGAAMMPCTRWQRSPVTSSSYSSVSRRRARKSVDSTAGRVMPSFSPISR
jgi:hypothetical protein